MKSKCAAARGLIAIVVMRDRCPGLSSYLELFNLTIGKQAMMANSTPGSGKRQERNFEIVVNHFTISEDLLPQVSRQSVAALKNVFGHNIKKYSGTLHHKPGNDHVHFLVMSEAPKTKSAVKDRIANSMALIFGTETGSVEVKMFKELKADAGPAHGLKGLGNYRSLYVNNNDHENHRPKDPEHRTVEFMCGGEWGSRMEAPEMVLGDKALRCRWPQQLLRQRLQSFSARRMRNTSVCWKLPQTVWVVQSPPCRGCSPRPQALALCQSVCKAT